MDIESITRRVEERLRIHEELLHNQKERYEQHKTLVQDVFDVGTEEGASANISTQVEAVSKMRHKKTIQPPRIDNLHDMARVMEQKKEDARVAALETEQSMMRDRPEISQLAQSIEPTMDIISRFQKAKKDAESKLSKKKQQLENDKEVFPYQPEISKFAKQMYVDPLPVDKWLANKEKKIQQERVKKEKEEMEETQPKPNITPRSAHLAQKKDFTEGLQGLPRHEQILERDRISKWNQFEHQMLSEEENIGIPRISYRAAMLEREGDVGSRLYEDSFELAERKREYMEKYFAQEREENTHVPQITARAHHVERVGPVEEHMMEMEQQRQARLLDASLRWAPSHQPTINPVSEEIAARLPETSMDRILKQKAIYISNEEPCPFQPKITDRSREIDKSRSSSSGQNRNVQERIESFQARERARIERIRQQQELQEARELEECTFQPYTTNSQSALVGKAIRNNVYNRVEQWQRRREQKRREAALEAEERALSECTFRPEITDRSRSKAVTPQTIYGDDGKCWGFHEFVARQEEARRIRKEREEHGDRVWVTGEKWKNEVTTPQEFRLGVSRPHGVKSLQRPARAASAQRHLGLLGGQKQSRMNSSMIDFSFLHMGTLSESSPLSYMPTNTSPGVFSSQLSSTILSTDANPLLRRALDALTRNEGQ